MRRVYEKNQRHRNRYTVNLTASDKIKMDEVLEGFAAQFKGVTPSISLIMQIALEKFLAQYGLDSLDGLHKELAAKSYLSTTPQA